MSTYNEILDTIRKHCIPASKVKKALAEHDGSVVSGWKSGVYTYACELLNRLFDDDGEKLNQVATPDVLNLKNLLNGASDWEQYSYGGCSLIYDVDIAKRLCTKSELARVKGGEKAPNARENWLDVQARALRNAANMLLEAV